MPITEFITINKQIAEEYLTLAKRLTSSQRFSPEVIQLLIRSIKDPKQEDTRLILAETFGYLTNHPEIFSTLVNVFHTKEKGMEWDFTNSLNYIAGKGLLKFLDRKAEVKEIFLKALRDSPIATIRLVALNLLGTEFQEYSEELKPIFRKIYRDDKSEKVRIEAWYRFLGLATEAEVKAEQIKYKRELLYSAIFRVLEKIQPNLQVPLSRIIELSDKFFFEHAKEMKLFGIDLQKFPQEIYIEIIHEILENEPLKGKYFDFEHVFVREDGNKTPVISPITSSKEYLCFNCGYIIDKETSVCPSCNENILRCNVCKLPISFGEEAGKCSLCGSAAHLSHFQEWVKIKGKCPTCQKKIPLEGIVPLSMEIKKT
ncbi:MAG: hypothetical protein K9W42_06550 [Candidatus Heimdallarchaeota archaeon]|nr:hypothetical protein [Candidatus Heimdallarchaeota archaeon]